MPGGILVIDDVHRYLPSESRAPLARKISDGAVDTGMAGVCKQGNRLGIHLEFQRSKRYCDLSKTGGRMRGLHVNKK